MTNTITLLDIIEDTVVDGPGFRVSVYAAGCSHHCSGCHNPQSWNLRNGHPVPLDYIIAKITNNPFSNVTFSGGDPLFQVEGFTQLAQRLKSITSKNIWCYTGFRYEEIINSKRLSQILPYIDVLVDGRFDPAKRKEGLLFRGSSNQRLINVPASLRSEKVILWEYNPYPPYV